jgi:hypothetical protein
MRLEGFKSRIALPLQHRLGIPHVDGVKRRIEFLK